MESLQRASAATVILCLALTGLAGCRVDVPALSCTRAGECALGQACVQGVCISGDAGQDVASDAPGDTSDASTDVPIVWDLDIAPGRDTPQEYTCEGGPDADFDTHVIIRPGPSGHWRFEDGVIQGASGNGQWYARSLEGWEQIGTIVTDPATGEFDFPVPTSCGATDEEGRETLVKLLWEGAPCDYLAVFSVQTQYCVTDDVLLTLYWNAGGDNLDLHLVRPGGQLNDPFDDCNSWTCVGQAPDWGAPGTGDDPLKSQDSTSGSLPEGIFLTQAQEGTYTVFVERGPEDSPTTPSDAIVIVTAGGRSTATQIDAIGSQSVWAAATIAWPSGQVVPSEEVHDCGDSWGSNGCELPLPE